MISMRIGVLTAICLKNQLLQIALSLRDAGAYFWVRGLATSDKLLSGVAERIRGGAS